LRKTWRLAGIGFVGFMYVTSTEIGYANCLASCKINWQDHLSH